MSLNLSKPGAIRSSRDVGVAIERNRDDLTRWRAARGAR
jgi:dihydroneopterin aldolase